VQSSVLLEMLVVHDLQGQSLAGSDTMDWPLDLLKTAQPRVVSPGSNEPPTLIVTQGIFNPDHQDELMGYVRLGQTLDSAYWRELANLTGFEQSLIYGGRRLASSLVLESIAEAESEHTTLLTFTPGTSDSVGIAGREYFTKYITLPLSTDHSLVLEIALPVDAMRQAQFRARLTLILSTALVAVLASGVAIRYAHQITSPLRTLTMAAEKIGLGDLSTPVPVPAAGDEIAMLAMALEESRLNTRRVMEELSHAMAWSETLIQSISEGIVTVDKNGLITSYNQGAERILGYDREQVINQPLGQIFLMQEGGNVSEMLSASSGTRQVTITTRTGISATLSITSTRFATPDRRADETALVLRDITEQEALQNLRSYFLANISHEFRTPLSALNASVEVMLSELDDLSNEDVRRLLSAVHMSVTGLQTLIDNLLESASIEAGRFTIHRQAIDLDQVIDEAIQMLQPLLDRRQQNIAIQKKHDPGLIFADPTRITQVLVNLISNASKYGPIDQPIEISITENDEQSIKVSIADHGPGLAPSERSTLFRRFVRLRSDPSAQYGIGLGLHVVKAIVEEHGGEVGVEGRPEGGSVFWFSLPRARGKDHESTRR